MLKEEDFEIGIKLVIVGNGGVGKSSLIQRYCKGVFTKDYKKTIGVDFLEKQIDYNGEQIRLQIWDTAGQEEFDAITKSYYRGAQACLLAYSATDRASFNAIQSWKNKVEHECGQIVMFLVQNKIDLLDSAQVNWDEGEDLARKLNLKFFRTSAKDNINIDDVFMQLAEAYVNSLCTSKEDIVYQDKLYQTIFSNPTSTTRHSPTTANRFKKQALVSQYKENVIRLEPSKRRGKQKKEFLKQFSNC